MMLGGTRDGQRDASTGSATPSRAVNTTTLPSQHCGLSSDHRPHGPYIRSGDEQDYACPGGPPDALRAVVDADRGVAAARRELYEAVRRARAERHSYADIGSALGVTRQAAWERFSKLEERAS